MLLQVMKTTVDHVVETGYEI